LGNKPDENMIRPFTEHVFERGIEQRMHGTEQLGMHGPANDYPVRVE
jgi:hypothetical protein